MLPCTSPGPSVSALGKAVPYNSSTAFGILHSGVNRTYVRHSDHALRGNKGNMGCLQAWPQQRHSR